MEKDGKARAGLCTLSVVLHLLAVVMVGYVALEAMDPLWKGLDRAYGDTMVWVMLVLTVSLLMLAADLFIHLPLLEGRGTGEILSLQWRGGVILAIPGVFMLIAADITSNSRSFWDRVASGVAVYIGMYLFIALVSYEISLWLLRRRVQRKR